MAANGVCSDVVEECKRCDGEERPWIEPMAAMNAASILGPECQPVRPPLPGAAEVDTFTDEDELYEPRVSDEAIPMHTVSNQDKEREALRHEALLAKVNESLKRGDDVSHLIDTLEAWHAQGYSRSEHPIGQRPHNVPVLHRERVSSLDFPHNLAVAINIHKRARREIPDAASACGKE